MISDLIFGFFVTEKKTMYQTLLILIPFLAFACLQYSVSDQIWIKMFIYRATASL